jgi:hypothetical protein
MVRFNFNRSTHSSITAHAPTRRASAFAETQYQSSVSHRLVAGLADFGQGIDVLWLSTAIRTTSAPASTIALDLIQVLSLQHSFLLKGGADPNIVNDEGEPPIYFPGVERYCDDKIGLRMIRLLVEFGADIHLGSTHRIWQIWKDKPFFRAAIACVKTANASSTQKKIQRKKAAKKKTAKKKTAKKGKLGFDELWDLYVPDEGTAETKQGEVIRLSARLSSEYNRNGNINWEMGSCEFAEWLGKTLNDSAVFTDAQRRRIRNDIKKVVHYGETGTYDYRDSEDEFDRLKKRAVDWCNHHKKDIPNDSELPF